MWHTMDVCTELFWVPGGLGRCQPVVIYRSVPVSIALACIFLVARTLKILQCSKTLIG
jgi:hypothetical protein